MLHYAAVIGAFKAGLARPLDRSDLSKLNWTLNFTGVIPWALILFAAMLRLARYWNAGDRSKPFWAAWAAIAGTLALDGSEKFPHICRSPL